jgi:hypothetical protein
VVLRQQIRVPVADFLTVVARLGEAAASGPRDERHYHVIDGGKPASGSKSTVRIVFLERNADAFEVVVDYNLVSDLGTLTLRFEGGNAESLAEVSHHIKKGQRRIVFREKIQVPAAAADSVRVSARLDDVDSLKRPIHTETDSKEYRLSR